MPDTFTLLPCPCCGAVPELFVAHVLAIPVAADPSDWKANEYDIRCRCGIQTACAPYPEACVERWNARVAPADVLQRAAHQLEATARDCLSRLVREESEKR